MPPLNLASHAPLAVQGTGPVLGTAILLESGDVARFASVGVHASYCRMVESARLPDGKPCARTPSERPTSTSGTSSSRFQSGAQLPLTLSQGARFGTGVRR